MGGATQAEKSLRESGFFGIASTRRLAEFHSTVDAARRCRIELQLWFAQQSIFPHPRAHLLAADLKQLRSMSLVSVRAFQRVNEQRVFLLPQ